MTLRRKDFAAFFAKVHGGHSPFRWQERLLDALLETGMWPQRLVAPTGAGKTAVIDVHVFAVALTAGQGHPRSPRVPRRLAMVVDRRVLVDDQYKHAEKVAQALGKADEGILAQVAGQLRELRRPIGSPHSRDGDDGLGPLVVAKLRGGVMPSRDWRDEPTACAVICATPDMWGSRLLFRGYGTALRARSREAGLLALDTAVVVDEAHLSRQLLETARGVTRLVGVAEEPLPVPHLQVVETTATPAGEGPSGRSVEVDEKDLSAEPVLCDRMTKPKPVRLVSTKDWPWTAEAQRRRVAKLMAAQAMELLTQPTPDVDAAHTIGCYVNTVAMAVDVVHALSAHRIPDGRPPRVVMVCGQNRPADLQRLPDGVLTVKGHREVDVLVTTQSLEVGVDLDLAAIVTELAPASALAQRAGRANRRGLRPAGPVRVIVPDSRLGERSRSGPYLPEELTAALQWLAVREGDPSGLAPWSVRHSDMPQSRRRRKLYQRPEMGDAWHWARTCDELAAEPELDLWLAEDFDQENTAEILVRDAMPAETAAAISLVRILPVRDDEVFTVPVRTAKQIVARAAQQFQSMAEWERPAAVRRRGDDITIVDPQPDADDIDVRPGDLVVIDSRTKAFTRSRASSGDQFSPPTPVEDDPDAADAVALFTADDLLHTLASRPPERGQVVLRIEEAAWPHNESVTRLLKQYAEDHDSATDGIRRRNLAELLKIFGAELGAGHPSTPMVEAAVTLLRGRVQDSDIFLDRIPSEDGERPRLILLDRRRAQSDDWIRQTWLPGTAPVPLDRHQTAVADRATWVGQRVGLPDKLVAALREAGAHHDDGKADLRFQAALGRTNELPLLAKSGGKSREDFRKAAEQAGLPSGWRHEQRSVVDCWSDVHAALPGEYARLAARLAGTSHGYGRHTFTHTGAELLGGHGSNDQQRLAEDLFDHGGWDNLIETTHNRWGVWGCAYLEALLRAADGQASGEDK
jgi:CRISPR-associated endonuclease/helicase Cas3